MKRIYLPIFISALFFISSLFFIPKDNKVFAATTVELYPTSDTTIWSWFPDSNFGTSDKLMTGKVGSGETKERSLIQFNIDSIPSNATITSAVLHLYLMGCMGGAPTNLLHIDRTTSPWFEKTATWNNAKNIFSSWSTGSVSCNSIFSYVKFDMTSLVKTWYNGTYSNYGFYIWGNEELDIGFGRDFYSRESATNRPKLVVVYTVPAQGSSPPSGDQTTSPGSTSTDQGTGVTTVDQGTGAGKQTTTGSAATSAAKKAASSTEKTGMSWTRVALLAALGLLLIAVVAGYIIYRRRKNRSPKKDSPSGGKPT